MINVYHAERDSIAWHKLVEPMIVDPDPAIYVDSETDLAAEGRRGTRKMFWIATLGDPWRRLPGSSDELESTLAFCALWINEDGLWQAGHNYEFRGAGRALNAWQHCHRVRQRWMRANMLDEPAVTFVFHDVLDAHLLYGWQPTGLTGVSTVTGRPHEWYKMIWAPRPSKP